MTYAHGIDISRYNVSFEPEKAIVGIDFIFQKATEGTTYIDSSYDYLWAGVQQIGIRGAYHYQRSGMSWQAQADHFLDTQSKHDYHMLVLDLESYGNIYSPTFFADTKRIIDYWREQEPKKPSILYTNFDGYKQLYYSLLALYGNSVIHWLDGMPLWIANPNGVPGNVPLPPYRKTWEFHQYSWNGNPIHYGLGGTKVDENVFNGTTDQLKIWLGISGTSGIPPSNGGSGMKAGILLSGLNMRSGPGVSYGIIGTLALGDMVLGEVDTVSNWMHFTKIIRKSGTTEMKDGWASAHPSYMTLIDISAATQDQPITIESTDVWKDNAGNILATYKGTLTRQ